MTNPLDAIRLRINNVDQQLLKLINQRANLAQETAVIKQQADKNIPLYRPEREVQVLKSIMDSNLGPLKDEEIARLFREIMSACLAHEQITKIAYLGPEGTFTQQAALKHFGESSEVKSMPLINDVFREVESGSVHFGVVPVENSTEGVVSNTLDCFTNSNCKICGEVELRIHHNLMVSDVTQIDKISTIYSHAQSLGQCRQWLDTHYPNAERVSVSSNAEAAKRIQTEWNSAAIAGEMSAKLYGLNILAQNIEDQPDNSTRFLVLGNQKVDASGQDKSSIILFAHNEPGILLTLLEPFRAKSVNLTRIETRPSPSSKWGHIFFVDFDGHVDDEPIQEILNQLTHLASEIKILGSYPKAVL